MLNRHARRTGAKPRIAPVTARDRLDAEQHHAAEHQHAAQQIGGRTVVDRLELVDDRRRKGVEAHQHEEAVFTEQVQPDQQRAGADRQPQLRQHDAPEDLRRSLAERRCTILQRRIESLELSRHREIDEGQIRDHRDHHRAP